MTSGKLPYLNLGCGPNYHRSWVNLDLNPPAPEVTRWNLEKGVPFSPETFEVVYHSHLLEHLPKPRAEALISECARILKPGGIIRIAIPDLEAIARAYLDKLESALKGNAGAHADYEWMLLELLDQGGRDRPGGEMESYLSRETIENREFVLSRIGSEGEGLMSSPKAPNRDNRFLKRLASKSLLQIATKLRAEGFTGILWRLRAALASLLVFATAGKAGLRAFRVGLFRSSGETHQWMYDRYSLSVLLERSGFSEIKVCRHDESRIPDFFSFALDSADGRSRKPDSLYIEAVKRRT